MLNARRKIRLEVLLKVVVVIIPLIIIRSALLPSFCSLLNIQELD